MKRLAICLFILLLAACHQQRREFEEPDFNDNSGGGEPARRPEDTVEGLMMRAREEYAVKRQDDARVTLHQIFRRDRWHPEANTLYQDLMIEQGRGNILYQEYLDLYEANKSRGDALWFHLRPLLIQRGIKACEVERHRVPSEDELNRAIKLAEELELHKEPSAQNHGERLAKIDELLGMYPMAGGAIAARAAIEPEKTVKKYRELSEENPVSGDALYAYAMAVYGAKLERNEPIEMLVKGWILELPGVHLRLGLAVLCRRSEEADHDRWKHSKDESIARSRSGFATVSFHYFKLAAIAEKTSGAKVVLDFSEVLDGGLTPLEDLSQRR